MHVMETMTRTARLGQLADRSSHPFPPFYDRRKGTVLQDVGAHGQKADVPTPETAAGDNSPSSRMMRNFRRQLYFWHNVGCNGAVGPDIKNSSQNRSPVAALEKDYTHKWTMVLRTLDSSLTT